MISIFDKFNRIDAKNSSSDDGTIAVQLNKEVSCNICFKGNRELHPCFFNSGDFFTGFWSLQFSHVDLNAAVLDHCSFGSPDFSSDIALIWKRSKSCSLGSFDQEVDFVVPNIDISNVHIESESSIQTEDFSRHEFGLSKGSVAIIVCSKRLHTPSQIDVIAEFSVDSLLFHGLNFPNLLELG